MPHARLKTIHDTRLWQSHVTIHVTFLCHPSVSKGMSCSCHNTFRVSRVITNISRFTTMSDDHNTFQVLTTIIVHVVSLHTYIHTCLHEHTSVFMNMFMKTHFTCQRFMTMHDMSRAHDNICHVLMEVHVTCHVFMSNFMTTRVTFLWQYLTRAYENTRHVSRVYDKLSESLHMSESNWSQRSTCTTRCTESESESKEHWYNSMYRVWV